MGATGGADERSRDVQGFALAAFSAGCLAAGAAVLVSTRARGAWAAFVQRWDGGFVASGSTHVERDLGIELLVVGAIVAVLAVPRARSFAVGLVRRDRIVRTVAVLMAALWTPIAIFGHSAVVSGGRRWFLFDDAMISMRYAHNLAAGHGLVWNTGQRVEGYTNFAWTVLLAVPHLLRVPERVISLVVLAMALGLAIAVVPLLARLVRALGGGDAAVAGTLITYALSRAVFAWQSSGLETGLLLLLVVWATTRLVEEAGRPPTALTAVLIAATALVRADALVLMVLLYLVGFCVTGDRRRWLRWTVASLAIPIAYHAARAAYYHELLPNTARLKITGWPGRYETGIRYTVDVVLRYQLVALAAVIAVVRVRTMTRLSLAGLLVAYTAYIATTGGDAWGDARFFVPVLPILFALAFTGIGEIAGDRIARGVLIGLLVVSVPLLVPGYPGRLSPDSYDVDNTELAEQLLEPLPPTAKVASFFAGTPLYFSDAVGIDLLGKMDPVIARESAYPGANRPGHNKFDYVRSIEVLEPDIVLAPFGPDSTADEMRPRTFGDNAYIGNLWFDPTFHARCFPNPIREVGKITAYRCDWAA
jgi:hypothetical protein